jgi:L-fuculose-phosphate aldolase
MTEAAIQESKKEIIKVGKELYDRGLIVGGDGNLSIKIEQEKILCTPKGVCKGKLSPEQICIVDLDGNTLNGDYQPSSELKMHLEVYQQRPDINAVCHAHPPLATGFACSGQALDKAMLAEVILTMGYIPLAPYAMPSTEEVPLSIRELIRNHDAVMLANHGVLTAALDLTTAYNRMETIEHFAKISLVTRILGQESLLTGEQVQRLKTIWDGKGVNIPALEVEGGIKTAGESNRTYMVTEDQLEEIIIKAIKRAKE